MTIRLRPDQERVAEYRGGYMAVPAVPGAGKTTVLACLAADLIDRGLPDPGRILIVTYTHSAVGNFKSRIGNLLHARGLPRSHGYEVRTIHSLAVQIVRERPEAIGWPDTFAVLDEHRQNAILGALTRQWITAHQDVWESLVRTEGPRRQDHLARWAERTQGLMRSLIHDLKARCVTPQEAVRLTRSLPGTAALRWVADLYGDYQRALALEGAVDFGDLMLGAYRLLEQEPDVLGRLRQRWTYLFEDEAQDSYRLQEQVLRLLAGPDGNLVRVGDANQAIMGSFTSAESDLFRRFVREPGVAVRPLTMAGRSSREIIGLANELVRWTRAEHPEVGCRAALEDQRIEPVPPGYEPRNPEPAGRRVLFRVYPTYAEEMAAIARMAARSVKRAPESTVAVLLPTNAMVAEMEELLRGSGSEVEAVGRSATPERLRVASDLLAALDYLAAPHLAERRRKVEAGLDGRWPPGEGSRPASAELLDRWLAASLLPADELLLLMAADLGHAGEELAIAQYLAYRARRLLEEEPLYGLPDVARELALELPTLGWLGEVLYDRKGFDPRSGVVYVSTCHSAKGLEWDTVYLGALTRGEFPATAQDWIRSELWYLVDSQVNPEAVALAQLERLLEWAGAQAADPAQVDSARVGEADPAGAQAPHPAGLQAADPAGLQVADPALVAGGDPIAAAKREQICERLRLLYVAITRARENLLLSCHLSNQWGKEAAPTLAFQHLKAAAEARR